MDTGNTHFVRCLEAMKASPFLGGMDTGSLKDILARMTLEVWPAKTFKNSADAKLSFHMVVSGRLKVYKIHPSSGRQHTLFLLGRGDVFDVMYLMDDKEHDIYWEAKDELQILKISLNDMRQFLFDRPVLQRALLQYMSARMLHLEEVATDISMHSTLVRLSHLLLHNINRETSRLEVVNTLPNEELASLIGTTRAVVNRHIQELKRCGAITVRRKYIDVQDLQTLIAVAEERYKIV
ncbi:Crp/Fnr family transcriptional regulator [Flagellimonas beolgyonensis]|uniref:Crp/Fnr family transcriptional regulator n=1 Tax=Flagellimonas beolgyonensis TaxID=864064 RepID=UPI003D64B8A9